MDAMVFVAIGSLIALIFAGAMFAGYERNHPAHRRWSISPRRSAGALRRI